MNIWGFDSNFIYKQQIWEKSLKYVNFIVNIYVKILKILLNVIIKLSRSICFFNVKLVYVSFYITKGKTNSDSS